MNAQGSVEERVAALEKALTDLREEVHGRVGPPDWIRALTGSVSDPDAFDEALELGRAWRRSDIPEDGRGP